MLEFLSTGLVGIMGLILLAVQIGCFIHAIKTGRPFFWLWLLFMFPGIAVIAYLLIEVRPTMGKLDWQSIRWKLSSPAERIRVRRDELRHSNTIKNRYRLSDELIAAGNHEEACRVLTDGMCGVFADDAELMLKVAKTHLDCGRIDQARDLLSRLRPLQGVDFQYEYQLAQARVLAGQGDPRAEEAFQALMSPHRTEASHFYYAKHAFEMGRKDEAQQILRNILQRYRSGTTVWRFQEKEWYQRAKRLAKQLA